MSRGSLTISVERADHPLRRLSSGWFRQLARGLFTQLVELVGRDGIEPPQLTRGVYNALGSPVPSLPICMIARALLGVREGGVAEGEGVEPSTHEVGPVFETGCAPPRTTFRLYKRTTKLVRVVGFEPTASCVRGRHSRRAELHPVVRKLALRREIESLSPDRQSGRLTRCVTERIGASGSTRTSTECGLGAFPLPIGVQTRSCRMPALRQGSLRCNAACQPKLRSSEGIST